MKIVYCICSLQNPGGMERVLLNKVSYLVGRRGWNITVVTTDQKGRPTFYHFPDAVKMVDLGINYTDDNGKHPLLKILGYLKRRRLHRKRLSALLKQEKADIVVSLYPSESSFIPGINDGSKKVLELHYCKFFRLQYNRSGLLGLIDRLRTRQDERIVRRFDKFVVLTHEDKGYWGDLPNIEVIPNAAMNMSGRFSDVSSRRVIAVGRLDYQKGFDRLLQAWKLVQEHDEFRDWHLDIFGQGEWRDMLQQTIEKDGFRVLVDSEGKVLTDMVLLAKLRKLRLEIARKNELAAFRVLQNDVLVRLATDKPVSREEFVAIKGLGDRKCEQYGDEFIQAIREYLK